MNYQKATDEESKQLLKRLVQVNTCQPEGNEAEIIELIRSLLPDGLECSVVSCGSGRASLVAKLPGKSDKGGLAFLGHVDTVACRDLENWKYDPFEGRCEGGTMFARGAADMKGGDAAMIMAARRLAALPQRPDRPIYFCFTADEENAGAGVRSLEERGCFDDLDGIIVCEPSDEKISFCEKGALWLRLDVQGEACHASRPYLGKNAVEYAMRFAQMLRERAIDGRRHPILGSTTMAVTKLHGGEMTNIVPPAASMELDIRTIPGHSHTEILSEARGICAVLSDDGRGAAAELTVLNDRPAIECGFSGDFREGIAASASESGLNMSERGHWFFTDASLVIPQHSVPFVIAGPGDDKQAHVSNERIELSSVTRFSDFYMNYVLSRYYSADREEKS